MKTFTIVWAGQLVSSLGTATSAFALAVWFYGQSGAIGSLSALAIAVYVPQIVVSPLGGQLADRFDRRRVMIVAEGCAAAATLGLVGFAWNDSLTLGPALALVALGSASNALSWPSLESATVTLVAPGDLVRANGMLELSRAAAQLLAPMLGGSLLGAVDIGGILVLDAASFAVGIAALLATRIPRLGHVTERARDLDTVRRLIARNPGLVAMLLLFAITSLTFAVVDVALKPIVLSLGSPWRLGAVLSTVGVGMVVGSVALTAWNPARPRMLAILIFQGIEGGSLVLAGTHPTFGVLCVAAFAYGLVIPLTFGCARAVFQRSIPEHVQGRAAALRNVTVIVAIPLGYAAATPLAEALALPSLVVAMGVVVWIAAIAVFGYRPYRELDHSCLDRSG